MKKEKLFDWLSIVLILGTVVSAFYFYDILPSKVVTHWDYSGQPDGYGSKAMGAFMAPAILVFIYLLFKYLPKLDPKRRNYDEFLKDYKAIQLVIVLFFTAIHFITNLGNKYFVEAVKSCLACQGIYIPILMVPDLIMALVGLMFIAVGFYLKNIKPNWFIGIRTPWTLSNDEVWVRTHKLGGKLFVIAGLIFIISIFLPANWAGYLFGLAILLILSSIIYSYIIYKQIGDKKPE